MSGVNIRAGLAAVAATGLALLVAACAAPLLNGSSAPARLQQLIEDRQYRRALAVIDSVEPESPGYSQAQALRDEVLASMERYDAEVIDKTAELSKEGQWPQAAELFAGALPRLPESSRSHAAYRDFRARRSEYIDNQQLKLNILLAERMVEEGEYRANIHSASPSSRSAGRELKKYHSRRRDVAEYLASQGLAALAGGDLGSAKKYLKLSQRLAPDSHVELALDKLNDQLNERWRKHLRKREQHYRQMVARYDTALSRRELQRSRELLAELVELNPQDSANRRRQRQLAAAIERELQSAIARGEAAYSDGDVQLALKVWKSAARLSPDHPGLLQHIDRAERFMENYESLK